MRSRTVTRLCPLYFGQRTSGVFRSYRLGKEGITFEFSKEEKKKDVTRFPCLMPLSYVRHFFFFFRKQESQRVRQRKVIVEKLTPFYFRSGNQSERLSSLTTSIRRQKRKKEIPLRSSSSEDTSVPRLVLCLVSIKSWCLKGRWKLRRPKLSGPHAL